jgi:hypothetical protein
MVTVARPGCNRRSFTTVVSAQLRTQRPNAMDRFARTEARRPAAVASPRRLLVPATGRQATAAVPLVAMAPTPQPPQHEMTALGKSIASRRS